MRGQCHQTPWRSCWGLLRVIEIVEILSNEEARSATDRPARLSDEQCVLRVQRGDLDAFSELVRRYQNKVYRYVLQTIGCPEEAQDLTQDTFIRVFNQLERWRPKALFRTWLFRIASNAAIDHLRRRRVWSCVPIDDVGDSLSHDVDIEARLDSEARFARTITALTDLSPIFRQTLLLRELEGMSYAGIADVLSINEGTVKSRIAPARRILLAQVDAAEDWAADQDDPQ